MTVDRTSFEKMIKSHALENIGDFNVNVDEKQVTLSWTFFHFERDHHDVLAKMHEKIKGLPYCQGQLEIINGLRKEYVKLQEENAELKKYQTYYEMELKMQHGPGPIIMFKER